MVCVCKKVKRIPSRRPFCTAQAFDDNVECVFVHVVQLGEVGGQSTHFVLDRIRLQSVHRLIRDVDNAEHPTNDHGVLSGI